MTKILFITIFLLAAFFRLSGNNWDQGYHLHPDERFLTMVTTALKWPHNISSYLDTSTSTLNPHNMGYGFYVYGTFPVFFTKWVAGFFNLDNYTDVTLLGRFLSGLVDLGTLVLVYLIATSLVLSDKLATSKKKLIRFFPAISTFLYATTVLSIQLSHYYAVDTYLTFFITLTFFLCTLLFANQIQSQNQISNLKNQKYKSNRKNIVLIILIGILFGLAIASKISAILFLPVIILVLFYKSILYSLQSVTSKSKFLFDFLYVFLIFAILFLISAYLTIRFAQPYLFEDARVFTTRLNPKVLANWKELSALSMKGAWFPPATQWMHTKAYLYPLKHNFFFGLGIPLGVVIFLGLIYLGFQLFHHMEIVIPSVVEGSLRLFKKDFRIGRRSLHASFGFGRDDVSKTFILFLSLLWILIVVAYQGRQTAMNLRYFHPIYPFLCILGGWAVTSLFSRLSRGTTIFLTWVGSISLLLYPVAFMAIYTRPITRLTASKWIYTHIPAGTLLAGEHWDDFLPLGVGENSISMYNPVEMPVYGAETKEKWDFINSTLFQANYIILSSNRAYGSIVTTPERYPLQVKYYEKLFDGTLGFEKAAEFTSRPTIPIPGFHLCFTPPSMRYGIIAKSSQTCSEEGIVYVDDYADESFTVYDHPKVIIFKKVKQVEYGRLLKVPK